MQNNCKCDVHYPEMEDHSEDNYSELKLQNEKLKKLLKSLLDKDISVNQRETNERNAKFDLWLMENERTISAIKMEWDFIVEMPTTIQRVKYIYGNYTDSLLLAKHIYEYLLSGKRLF